MRKLKLLIAACALMGGVATGWAQTAPFLQEKSDFSGATVSSLTTFVPSGTTYTLELTGCVADQEITVPGGSFSYTPTASGTVRFVRNGGDVVYVYEGTTYIGTVEVSTPEVPTYPTGLTSASAENLIQNGGFEDTSDGTYTSGRWKPTYWTPYNKSKAAPDDGVSVRSGSEMTGSYNMLMHNAGYYLTQQLSSGVMKNFTPYQISYKHKANDTNQAGSKYKFQVGSAEFSTDYFNSTENNVGTTSVQTYTTTFTTPATVVDQPWIQLYRSTYAYGSSNQALDRFDEFILVAATGGGIGITGATGATFLTGTAYAPEGVIAAQLANGPIDVTSLITNAAVVTDATGWTNGNTAKGQQYTEAPDDTYLDKYGSNSVDMKQTISLPSGYYLLKAATRSSAYASGNIYAYVTADDATFRTDIHKEGASGNLLGGGWAWTRVPVTVSQSSSVTIGFWSNTGTNQWAGADNFSLVCYDSELNMTAALFDQVRTDATKWKESLDATLTTGAKNALTAENGKSYTSVVEYNEAIVRLETAIAFARTGYTAMKAKYDAVKALVKALPDQTTVYTGSATLNIDEDVADAAVEAATTEAGINAAINLWRNAAAEFLGNVTINDEQYFDITNIFLDNANFSDGNILGWETNYVSGQQAQNIGYQGSSYTNEDVTISQFIEAWRPQPNTLGDGYLRQTVSNLPEGKYTLEADAISVQQSDENIEVTGSYLYIYADAVDYKTSLNTLNNKPQHFSTEFLNTGEGDVIFGLKTESSTGNWLCADNFTVKFYGVDLSAYESQLADAVAAAEAVTGIPAGAASVLASVVTANNKSWSSSSEYAAAISAIQTATTTALTFQTPYANYNTAKAAAEAFEEENFMPTDWTTLQSAITANTVDLNSTAITVDALNTATANLNTAITAATAAVAAKTVYDDAVALIDGGKNVDLTSLIANPSFETDGLSGWTQTNAETQDNKAFDNVQGNIYAQRWHFAGNVDLNQTIAYLPAGIYEVSAYSYFSETGARLYANSTEVAVTTSKKYSVLVEIADKGSITLGAGCASTATSWWCVDDFKLTYLGNVNDLTYTLASGKMGTDKAAAQTAAEAAFIENKTFSNYNALLAAIAEAEASVAHYATLKTAIEKAEAVKEANNFVTSDAATTFANEISTATAAWTNVTYTDEQATAEIATLGTTVSGWHAIGSEGKAGAFMASAWGKNEQNWWDAPYINTWSTEGDNDGSGFSVPFFEYYTDNDKNLPTKTMTATLTGLENGCYDVTIWARVQRRSDANFNNDNSYITMSVNGGEAVSIMSNTNDNVGNDVKVMRLGRYTARGMVTDGTLTLTINVKEGANVHWLSWRDVKYTKVADEAVEVTEAGFATYVSDNDLNFTGISGLTAYKATVEGSIIKFSSVTTVPAGEGVLLKADEGNYNIPVTAGLAAWNAEDNAFIRGTGAAVETGSGPYNYILNKVNGVVGFYRAAGQTVATNRAYLQTTTNAARLNISFDDDDQTTGIARVEETVANDAVYTLSGVRVAKPTKGLYIMNGKKVVVK